MSSAAHPKSIHVLRPLETGGVEARQGFGLQDHVAAGFCIEFTSNCSLQQVWCETQDDITLIWETPDGELAEFVQVKGNEPDQLWSIAMLCEREGKSKAKKVGTSILERSLMYDRCLEPCIFRVVTSRPVMAELEILTYSLESDYRCTAVEVHGKLVASLTAAVGDFQSENSRCCKFWASSTTWQVEHSAASAAAKNQLTLSRAVKSLGSFLYPEQLEDLYNQILTKVARAAATRHDQDPAAKKIIRADFLAWLRDRVSRLEYPVPPGSGKVLASKMRQAGIAEDVIEEAIEQRRLYRMDLLTPQYQEPDYRRTVDRGVTGVLHLLKSNLDAGLIEDSGVGFHAACLAKLCELREAMDVTPKPDMVFLFGHMYNVTDRCGHRFRRPAV